MKAFRFTGLIPFMVVTLLVYLFGTYYLDSFLKKTIVKQGTKLNGALVEIDSLNLSFARSRLEIRGIRFTDPDDLKKNRLDIGQIAADFQFLPLLKKKAIIDEVRVAEVQWGTPRKKPGAIPASWQRAWEKEAKAEPSLFGRAFEDLKKRAKAELPEIDLNSLGDRFDPRKWVKLEDIESYQAAKELPGEIKGFASKWEKKGGDFVSRQKKMVSTTKKRIVSLDPRKIKNPIDALKAIDTVQKLQKEIKQEKASVKDVFGDAKRAVDENVARVKKVRSDFENDVDQLKKKIGFGDLKIEQLSESIFGPEVLERYEHFLGIYQQINAILAKLKDDGKEKPKRKRAKGRTIYFPVFDRKPSFLLSKLYFSADTRKNSSVDESLRGLFKAEGASFTSDQKLVGKPTSLNLSAEMVGGRFPRAQFKMLLDRTKEEKEDVFALGVRDYRLKETTLGQGTIFPIPLKQGQSTLQAKFIMRGQQMHANLRGNFRHLKYRFPKKKKIHPVKEILQEIMQTIREFKLRVSFEGTLKDPHFKIGSTIDDALRKGIEKVLLAKVKRAQAKLEAYLKSEIGSQIKQAEGLMNTKKKEILNSLKKQTEAVAGVEKQAKKRLRELKSRHKKLVKREADKLKKSLPTDKIKIPAL